MLTRDLIKIEHVKQIGGTSIMAYAIRSHAALLDAGLGDGYAQLLSWDQEAIVTTDGDLPVGIIIFMENRGFRAINVYLGWVESSHRGLGIYRRMWDELVRVARTRDGIARIQGVTKVENEAMRAVAKALGRVEESINLNYEL